PPPMVSLIVENVTSQQHPMLILTSHSSEDSLDALNPSLSTIRAIPSFKDRRLVVHESFKPQLILSASSSFLCHSIDSPAPSTPSRQPMLSAP
ncbi:hypothetical protein A2U01_0071984, partial [Trifolium medium]|nr:hypothetical protein [Trifolium medium]